ncbi:hypothetical protein BaRGS_00011206, partial [Batillaria attramentaria]
MFLRAGNAGFLVSLRPRSRSEHSFAICGPLGIPFITGVTTRTAALAIHPSPSASLTWAIEQAGSDGQMTRVDVESRLQTPGPLWPNDD